LKLLQIKLSEVFECPSCREPLSLSDGYQKRNAIRSGVWIRFLDSLHDAFVDRLGSG